MLNERQAKAKGENLAAQGKQLSAAVRTKIITRDPDCVAQKRKREVEQKPKEKSCCSVFGKLVEDGKGLYLVTPVATKATVGASAKTFNPRLEEPECTRECTTVLALDQEVVYRPERPGKPQPVKIKAATEVGASNVYFIPWATEADSVSCE